jgi:hypothetical protein
MKRILLIVGLFFCFTSPSWAYITDNNPQFCTKFVTETHDLCVAKRGGNNCDLAVNRRGMESLYNLWLAANGHSLSTACRASSGAAEMENCMHKWNCYRGLPDDTTCITRTGCA